MARPTSRPKSDVSVALAELREHLGESQQQFAYRFKTTAVSIARYETSAPPRGAALERLWKLARRCGATKSADAFRYALDRERDNEGKRRRILRPENIGEANNVLQRLWMSASWFRPDSSKAQLLVAGEEIRAGLLELADLIALEGRQELVGSEEEQ